MKLEEENKLIVEFMGKKFYKDAIYLYQDRWEHLMPVVKKIWKDYQDGKSIGGTTLHIFYTSITATIEEVYLAVLEYIEWKNEKP